MENNILLNQNKNKLRKAALQKRNFLAQTNSIKRISSAIVSKILNSAEFLIAKNIALYYPYKNEVDLLSLINFKGKNFYFPSCVGAELKFRKYIPDAGFKIGKFGIKEATGEIISPKYLDLMYIPALIANSRKFRLGYGLGFYDKFFSKNNIKAKKIIVVPKIFINNTFVEDKLDVKCDKILSD